MNNTAPTLMDDVAAIREFLRIAERNTDAFHCAENALNRVAAGTAHTPAVPPVTALEEFAWGVIANAGGGNWKLETQDWQDAAARWRTEYHAKLDAAPQPAQQDTRQAQEDVAERITNYLASGGLFNPELMEHDKVRDLLIACRDRIIAEREERIDWARRFLLNDVTPWEWMTRAVKAETALATARAEADGGTYAIAERFGDQKRERSGFWHCPYCQTDWGYAKGELQKAREALEAERSRHGQTLTRLNQATAERAAVERKAARLAKRVKAGVCPCCKRTFQSLARHMATKHPEYAKP